MKLQINGKESIVKQNLKISQLLESTNLNPNNIIVQVDQEIIKKDLFHSFILQENSEVELLAVVGGG